MYNFPEYELLRAKNAKVNIYNMKHKKVDLRKKGKK